MFRSKMLEQKGFWFHLCIELFLLAGIVFVYFHSRPVRLALPIDDFWADSVSVYVTAGESGLYRKDFSPEEAIPYLNQIRYEPYPVIDDNYTAPGCYTLEILVHYQFQPDVLFIVRTTHSGLGDTVLVSTPDLFGAYGYTAYYVGAWPDSGDFWQSIRSPETEVPYSEAPSERFFT